MNFIIFKAGYEDIGPEQWDSLKDIYVHMKKVSWKNNTVIIPLKKLSIEDRRKRLIPGTFAKAPIDKQQLLRQEFDIEQTALEE